MKKDLKQLYSALGIVLTIIIWWVAAAVVGAGFILPSPVATLKALWEIISTQGFLLSVANTLLSSAWSFALSFVLGVALAILAKLNFRIHYMMLPLVAVTRTLPVTGIILVIFVVFGTRYAQIVIAFMVVFPLIYSQVYTAVMAVDKKLLDMAKVFGVGRLRQVAEIYFPCALPYIISAAAASFGLNIKVVISAEVLALPMNTIGFNIKYFYTMLQSAYVFAWIVVAVALSMICEYLIKLVGRLTIKGR